MKPFRVLIIHPTRGRPEEAFRAFRNHVETMAGENTQIKYIFSMDSDDKTISQYQTDISCKNVEVGFMITNGNSGCVDAVNACYNRKQLQEMDLIILTSDDMRLCQGWDISLKEILDREGYDKCIKTKQPGDFHKDRIMTLQIGGAKFFLDFNTFFWPDYVSMYADKDLSTWARQQKRYILALHLVCPHLNPQMGQPGALPPDETYAKENAEVKFIKGKELFTRRARQRFPIVVYKDICREVVYAFQFPDEKILPAFTRLAFSLSTIGMENTAFIINGSKKNILSELASIVPLHGSIFYVHRYNPRPGSKGALINYIVKNFIHGEYFFQSDIDIIYPHGFVGNQIQEAICENSFSRKLFYNQYLKEGYAGNDYDFIASHRDVLNSHHPQDIAEGLGVIHRGLFLLIHGYNEKMYGWGHEDLELNARLKVLSPIEYSPEIVFHLWHENTKPRDNENLSIYEATKTRISRGLALNPGRKQLVYLLTQNLGKPWGDWDREKVWWEPPARANKDASFRQINLVDISQKVSRIFDQIAEALTTDLMPVEIQFLKRHLIKCIAIESEKIKGRERLQRPDTLDTVSFGLLCLEILESMQSIATKEIPKYEIKPEANT